MNEIEQVENWQPRWCHVVTGMPLMGDPTGTSYPPKSYEKRRIYLGMKPVHKECGGDIVRKFDTRWEGLCAYTRWWDECELCGKKFNETEYE